jgi:hypothetical protein
MKRISFTRHIKFGIVCVLSAIVICILTIELGLALVGFNLPVFHRVDPELGMSLRPNVSGWQTGEGRAFVSINSHGFHDRERSLEKGKGVTRIAVLGDSYTEAVQVDVDKNFCSVIERILKDSSKQGHEFEVLNFGVSGYGTAQELLLLRKKVSLYSPDIVVLAFLTGNDIRNNSAVLEKSPRPFYIKSGHGFVLDQSFTATPYYSNRKSLLARSVLRLSDRSRLFQLMNRARRSVRVWSIQRDSNNTEITEFGLDSRIYQIPRSPEWVEAWEVTEFLLKSFGTEVRELGALPLVVTLSNGIQVDPREKIRRHATSTLGVEDLYYPDRRIERICVRYEIPVLVLAQQLLEIAKRSAIPLHGFENTSLFLGHWNENGHRIAGELIASRLLALFGNRLNPE